MSAAACKAAECSQSWAEGQSKREMHLRAVASHPEFTVSMGNVHDYGGREGKRTFKVWISALEQSPMSKQGMDDVQGIINQLTSGAL